MHEDFKNGRILKFIIALILIPPFWVVVIICMVIIKIMVEIAVLIQKWIQNSWTIAGGYWW